jgi:uncharacterized glyoxalase superfamily protein PhnB
MTETTPTVFPALRYADALTAIAWLERAFGFEQHVVHASEDGTVHHAELTYGNGMIMLGSARADAPAARETGIYVLVQNVDEHYTRAQAAGAEIVRAIQDTDYGSREYSVRDLEGNTWSFGTYDPFAPPQI